MYLQLSHCLCKLLQCLHIFFQHYIYTIHFGLFTWKCVKIILVGIDFGPYSICHGCMKENIKGFGWKCTRCVHYTLCSSCYFSGKHILDHRFARFDNINSRSVYLALCTLYNFIIAHYFVVLEPCACNKVHILVLYLYDMLTITCDNACHNKKYNNGNLGVVNMHRQTKVAIVFVVPIKP